LPCDPYTEVGFFRLLNNLDKLIAADSADIALIGIKPLLPTSKYGYIVPSSEIKNGAFKVSHFVEKPNEEKAARLINEGAYWNGGVFAFKLKNILDITKEEIEFKNYQELFEKYNKLQKISFDYKVVEKSERIAVVPYNGKWTDIGTWRTLADEMPATVIGEVIKEHTNNTFIINELNIPLIALGTKDLVIAASQDGILVSDLIESSNLKPLVEELEKKRPIYEERQWGEYTLLEKNAHSLVKHLYLVKGKSISYQSHKFRDEIWVITSGEGIFTLEGETKKVKQGDVLKIKKGQKHKIEAISELHITEVQLGEKFVEDDIERFDL
jgi:mannose-1-phosphate guanylyltransferase